MAGRVIVKTENTKMPSQLTFYKQGTRHEAQKSEQHKPQGAVKKLAVIFSQCAVNANNNDGEKEVELVPGVLVATGILLTIVLVSLDPPLYISHGERSALVSLNLVIAQ